MDSLASVSCSSAYRVAQAALGERSEGTREGRRTGHSAHTVKAAQTPQAAVGFQKVDQCLGRPQIVHGFCHERAGDTAAGVWGTALPAVVVADMLFDAHHVPDADQLFELAGKRFFQDVGEVGKQRLLQAIPIVC